MLELNRIYNGDCLELMKELPDKSVDLVLTDPPYGVKRDKGFGGFEGFGGFGAPIVRTEYKGDWDEKRPDKVYFDEMLRIGKMCIIFGGNFFADLLPASTHWIVWDKLSTMPTFGDCELAYTTSDRKSIKKYTREWNGLLGKEKYRWHATQKPEDLMTWIIADYSSPNNIILDPFIGSGTTAVAAIRTGRQFIGMEISSEYCKIAEKRIFYERQQLKLDI